MGKVVRRRVRGLIAAAVLPVVLAGCAIADRMSGVSQAKDLQQAGDAAEALIVNSWDTGITVNDDPVVGFLLEVRREGQSPYQAETKLRISRVHLGLVQPGAVVPVRVDPNDPSRVSLDIYNYNGKKHTRRI